jgi:hypothetical protein
VRLRQLGEHEPHVVHESDTIGRHVIDERDPVLVGHGTAFIATTKPWSGRHPRRFSGSADPPLPEVTIPPVHTHVNPLSRPANDGSYHTIGCRKLDLFGREVVAVDGTPMKAVNSTDRRLLSAGRMTAVMYFDRLPDHSPWAAHGLAAVSCFPPGIRVPVLPGVI